MSNNINFIHGIYKLSDIAAPKNATYPEGWVVRERVCEDGTVKGFEYGIYVNADVFVSVPVHVSLKSKMIPHKMNFNGYNYYLVPNEISFGVSSYTNKMGKVCPILVAASETAKNRFIASYATKYDLSQITDIKFSETTVIIRKYIDKERKSFAVIAFDSSDVINPQVSIEIRKGIIGNPQTYEDCRYLFTMDGSTSETKEVVLAEGEVFEPKYINFNLFIKPEPSEKKEEKNPTFKKPFNKRQNNFKKPYNRPRQDNKTN